MKKIILLASVLFLLGAANSFSQDSEQKFQGFNLEGYKDNGQKSWEVSGDTANIMGSKIELTNVNADIYDNEKINVVADKGVIDQENGNMNLSKDVAITHPNGGQMLTDSLNWNRNEDLITTDDDVMISDEGVMITGTGLKAHPTSKDAEILQDVTVMVDTEKDEKKGSEKVIITSDGPMVINQAESYAVFNDNVRAVQGDQTLKADKMEIYFDAKSSTIKKIFCIGNVEVVQGENMTYADRAEYNAAEQKLILTGRPKLILLTEGDGGIATFGN
ncbi:MAG: LPS export ABC transporter periplasmic protein LptC [Omnitrophica WOR_2 bacterium GWF2_38_59]|nr:MAG: LPS export ABC transporter periplasmic protein LptC [Omnitrophica WOR_2 bacterium GWF2_38_59]OGX47773.1 MAG: LPS export ABC transporter periplasmic protein LptC [Omnitrophica WOR_2 bacterium RIFOXYA2_FULL_38_17]OGX51173.1 MAG: LPS export ABC transporter periplasmic protein LptC [Omnitrophica WOR_2 bacterium RIFOXYA12_FULL_38_10]OGX56024.1 MAG: LPS export ABC transporter periplasmic protein LptC [Omnitrophica WOR_2 bacterium RIFOXYB2_FULL_38_16]OGX57698.1 MAG: LPS export ABC transporter 